MATIAVDVDDVVAQLLPEWVRRYNDVFNDTLTLEEITDWDISKFVSPACGNRIYEFLNQKDLYDDVELMPGAFEGIHALRERGHRLLFVTSATKGHAGQKLALLQRHGILPPGPTNPDYIEASDKSLIKADLIIDDRPLNCNTFGAPAILFSQPHNATETVCESVYRADTWSIIPLLVEVILSRDAIEGRLLRSMEQAVELAEASDTTSKPTNPKDAIGSSKLPVHLWPMTATAAGSMGLLDGALKYGRANYRAMGVRSSIYYDALVRHLTAWFEGEDADPDSGLDHWCHILACAAIVVDARAAGALTDDRQVRGGYRAMLTELTPHVARLKTLHATKAPKHYTIADNTPLPARTP